jgi:uncharacterized protein (DUF433 family)
MGDKPPFQPVLRRPNPNEALLSFVNLVEAHVLSGLRREYKFSLQMLRKAIRYVKRQFPGRHPLAEQAFATDGVDLFVERFGRLLQVNEPGQMAMRQLLDAHLERISRDPEGVPIKLYPFTRRQGRDEPKAVEIDARISFGRPVLVGTGIPTAVIAERYKGGETIAELAGDYDRSATEIEEAIRCELRTVAA